VVPAAEAAAAARVRALVPAARRRLAAPLGDVAGPQRTLTRLGGAAAVITGANLLEQTVVWAGVA
jgi:hypothetical protein